MEKFERKSNFDYLYMSLQLAWGWLTFFMKNKDSDETATCLAQEEENKSNQIFSHSLVNTFHKQ